MKTKSVKWAFGLAAAAVSTSGAMMLAPAMANAATAYPAHMQTASNVSQASSGWYGDPSGRSINIWYGAKNVWHGAPDATLGTLPGAYLGTLPGALLPEPPCAMMAASPCCAPAPRTLAPSERSSVRRTAVDGAGAT
jgi:hypothetical protein